MIKELKIKNGFIYANRDIMSSDITDPKILILWYRGCGYKLITIRNIIKSKFDMTDRQIRNIITNFEKKEGLKFRPYSNLKSEWEVYYKFQEMKQWGKPFNNDTDWTENRPLNAGDYRKQTGLTIKEQKLLRRIKK